MDVLVYGATGFTGRLVTSALARTGVSFGVAGRDRTRLAELAGGFGGVPVHVAPVFDDAALREACAAARVVISCAGPFVTLGEPLVRAAIDAGCHLLDSSGEQSYIRDVYERYGAAARKAGVCVVNGCAFEIALGDWAAELAAASLPGAPLDQLSVSYAVDGFKTTPGTRMSILASLEEPGYVWVHDRWEPSLLASESRPVSFPEPFGLRNALSFPSGEVITVPRHVDARRVQTYLSLTEDTPVGRTFARGISLLGPALSVVMQTPLASLARAKLADMSELPTTAHRHGSSFAIVARAERSHERRAVSVSGVDPYGVSAEILAYAAAQLVAGADVKGVLAPAEAFDAEAALTTLVDVANLTVVRE